MTENPRYSDEQVDAAIDELRAGGDPLEVGALEHFTRDQLARYMSAVDHEQLAVRSEIRRAWLEDPALRRLPAPFPMFQWEPAIPNDLSGLTE